MMGEELLPGPFDQVCANRRELFRSSETPVYRMQVIRVALEIAMKIVRQNDGSQRVLLHRILLLLFAVVLLLTLYANSLLSFNPLSEGTLIPLAEGWELSYQGSVIEEDIVLPYKIEGMLSGKTYVLSGILPEELPNTNVSLGFETSMRSLSVLIDGQTVYEYGLGDTPYRRPVLGGSFMHYIRLPDWSAGHELSLVMTFHSQNQFAGIIQLPTLGTKSDQLLYQLRELPNLIFGIIFLFAGLLAASVSFILTPGRKRESMWYFGWIEIALGAWIFAHNCTKFILIPNAVLALDLGYMALYLLPYFLIQYVRVSYSIIGRIIRIFMIAAESLIGAYIIVGVLQFLGIVQFSETLQFAGLYLLLFISALFLLLLIEFLHGNKDILTFLLAIGALFLTVFAELVLLLLSVVLENALTVHIGMAISGAILLYHSVRFIGREQESEVRAKVLLELSYTDTLTGAGNRKGYERRVARIMEKSRAFDPIGLLMVDIESLRSINDTFGRAEGDNVLKDLVLHMSNLVPGRSEVYRVGSDEFMVFVTSTTYEQMSLLCTDVQHHAFHTDICAYEVACGYSFYVKESEKSFEDAVTEADAAMYDCKVGNRRSRKASQTRHRLEGTEGRD